MSDQAIVLVIIAAGVVGIIAFTRAIMVENKYLKTKNDLNDLKAGFQSVENKAKGLTDEKIDADIRSATSDPKSDKGRG